MAFRKAPSSAVFGLLAEFPDTKTLVAAIRACRGAGYTKMEAYTPFPVHEVWEALGHRSNLPRLVLLGGITGAIVGFGMQYFASVIHYPINVGGRPFNSWPSFIVITFEVTVLFAALTAVFGMLALNGLPRPHHPCFDVPEFELASRDRFFLLIPHYDPAFEADDARSTLAGTKPLSLSEVPHP